MNKNLNDFLKMIMDPLSSGMPENYINSRKVHDNNLTLQMCYINGGALISGIAFNKIIVIRYNFFEMRDGFYVTVNAENSLIPLTIMNIVHFFEQGTFIEGTSFVNGGVYDTPIENFALQGRIN